MNSRCCVWGSRDTSIWTVNVMTVLFLPLLVKGGNGSFLNSIQAGDLQPSTTVVTTTLVQQENQTIYLWIPLLVVIIFAVIIVALVIIGRQTAHPVCKCLGVSPGLDSGPNNHTVVAHPSLHLNVNLQINTRDATVPETPPPSYAVIARQISYISTISQTSSQIEVPPGYDEALGITDGTIETRPKTRASQQLSGRGSVSSQNQLSKSSSAQRIRLFSRSSSATDSPRRPSLLRQSSTPAVANVVFESMETPVPETSLNTTALHVIHEATGTSDDTHPTENSENNKRTPFYIEDPGNEDSFL